MEIEEAIKLVKEWTNGVTFHEWHKSWGIVCVTLADELTELQVTHENAMQALMLGEDQIRKDNMIMREALIAIGKNRYLAEGYTARKALEEIRSWNED